MELQDRRNAPDKTVLPVFVPIASSSTPFSLCVITHIHDGGCEWESGDRKEGKWEGGLKVVGNMCAH